MGTCPDTDPGILSLNKFDDSILHRSEAITVTILLSTARSATVRFWKGTNSPTLVAIGHNIMWPHYKLSRITESLTRHKDEDRAHQKTSQLFGFP